MELGLKVLVQLRVVQIRVVQLQVVQLRVVQLWVVQLWVVPLRVVQLRGVGVVVAYLGHCDVLECRSMIRRIVLAKQNVTELG